MSKYNYFDSLEKLSLLSSRAVFLACSPPRASAHAELLSIRHLSDKMLCELERTLFGDFMPPLDRAGISRAAHGLCRIIARCGDIASYRNGKSSSADRKSKEAELCIRLSQLIEETVSRLRYIKRPDELPDIVGFRRLLCDAQSAHTLLLKKLSSGAYPRAALPSLCLLCALRRELSRTFDLLVEVMLENV